MLHLFIANILISNNKLMPKLNWRITTISKYTSVVRNGKSPLLEMILTWTFFLFFFFWPASALLTWSGKGLWPKLQTDTNVFWLHFWGSVMSSIQSLDYQVLHSEMTWLQLLLSELVSLYQAGILRKAQSFFCWSQQWRLQVASVWPQIRPSHLQDQ